jgi:hypothetical protein
MRWLISNPEKLSWPKKSKSELRRYSDEVQVLREALYYEGPKQLGAIEAAMKELVKVTAKGSSRKWWAFEGFTSVDCWLETDKLVLLVEGKRTDKVAKSTHWYPKRNQLVRNLEVISELDKPAFLLLAVEKEPTDLTPGEVAKSTPHLDESQQAALMSHSLGYATWDELRGRMHVTEDFPSTASEAIAQLQETPCGST